MIYIKNISLNNFKCFESTSSLELGKLTLLTGANSTGKSSLIYSILGVLQSSGFPLRFSANGIYIQMGNFLEMVFKHDSSRLIRMNFTLVNTEENNEYRLMTEWKGDSVGNPIIKQIECRSNYFHLQIDNMDKLEGQILNLELDPEKNNNREEYEEALSFASKQPERENSYIRLVEYLKYIARKTSIKKYVLQDGFLMEKIKPEVKYPLFFVLQDIKSLLEKYNQHVNYISSYRQPAKRIYAEEPVTSGKIATSGEGFINELLKWKDEKDEKFTQFVEAMKSMELLDDIEPSRLGAGQFKVGVRVHKDDEIVNLGDVGFGISQIMPIIIGDVEIGKNSTLYISQPEVHLHPKAQAKFGDYLVGQMKQGKRYVIESHSEYLMNRLRLAIVKGIIAEDDVKVYHMSQEKGQTKIYNVRFTKNGQIKGAPQDFFDTYMIDVMDIAMNAE